MSSRLYAAIDSRLFLTFVIACIVFRVSPSYAVDLTGSDEDTTERKDIYDRISTLVDSLRAWSIEPVETDTQDCSRVYTLDSLDLVELFPGSKIEYLDPIMPSDPQGTIRISLPPYMELLTTTLYFQPADSTFGIDYPQWYASVVVSDYLLIDDIPVSGDAGIRKDIPLVEHISSRLSQLRTIGLPTYLQASAPPEDVEQVSVTVRGRDMVDIPFSEASWFKSLSHIAAGMQVYAGLLEARGDSVKANLKFYILITYPDASGHHFLEWRESLVKPQDKWKTDEIDIIFTPYIRTDNLKELFAQPGKTDREPIELKIR